MYKKRIFSTLCFFLIFGFALYSLNLDRVSAASIAVEKTLVLYDAGSGSIPEASLMSFAYFPTGAAAPTYELGATILDTTTSGGNTYAGWIAGAASTPGFPILDRTAGFHVNFSLHVEQESHANHNRAGFSIIVLGEDARGIELAFWENEIWAQSDDTTGGLFRHGEGVVFSTVAAPIDYQLTIVDETYTLTANDEPVLTGPLRDYSNFEGFPDPYETSNFLFLGDDTTSAQARVRVSFVSVTGTEPVMPASTDTSTSTSTPLPTHSPPPLPSSTPAPSPTPAGRDFEICPSAWLLAVIAGTLGVKKFGAGH